MDKFIEKFSLEGKKAIVTGGAKGLCNGMAQALHDAGAEVVLLDILDIVEDSAKEMAKEGAMVHAVKGDLSDTDSLESVYNQCLEKLGGRVDILLNGAGIQYRAPAVDFPHDRWEKIVAINMNAVFYLSQLAGKTMIEQKYGKIINIASMTAFFASVLIPPSTGITAPEIYADASDARNTTSPWRSSGFPQRPIGILPVISSYCFGFTSFILAVSSVAIYPGAIAFTFTP